MKRMLLRFGVMVFLAHSSGLAIAQKPVFKWDKNYGTSQADQTRKLIPTSDGGYLIATQSASNIDQDKSENSRGGIDYWIIKIDAAGNKEWDRTYGGPANDQLTSVVQTVDGGYIIGGNSSSGIGGDKTENFRGSAFPMIGPLDYWIIKVDADGNKQWDKTLGTVESDWLIGVHQSSDGSYFAVGSTAAGISEDKTVDRLGFADGTDYWIVKLDASGTKIWDKVAGSMSAENGTCSLLLSDGGLLIGGYQDNEGYSDKFNITKVDSSGVQKWHKRLGSDFYSVVASLKQAANGGYFLGGFATAQTPNGDQSEAASGRDYWIVKTDTSGVKIWDRTVGTTDIIDDSTGFDDLTDLVATPDGGLLAVGLTSTSIASKDKTEKGYGGGSDAWLIRLNADGSTKWDKTIGWSSTDVPQAVVMASDGGFIVSGYTLSPAGPYRTNPLYGQSDIWLFKLAEEQPPLPVTLKRFSAAKENTTAALTWQTTSETNSDHFEVQHSLDGKTWDMLAMINAQGESKELSVYHYAHTTPVLGKDNLYRLKMVDADGSFTYSRVQHLKFEDDFEVVVYPNPASEKLVLPGSPKVESVTWYNNSGLLVQKTNTLSVPYLTSGTYLISIECSDGKVITTRILIR